MNKLRLLNEEEVDEILSLKFEDITMTKLKSYFARTIKQPEPRFKITDYFFLPENTCSNNLPGYTTLGLYFFNKLVTDRHFKDVTGYINVPITNSNLKKLYNLVSQARFDDKISQDDFYFLIDILEWLGGGDLAELLNPSLTTNLLILPPELKKLREDLFKKYEKEIETGDVNVGAKIEEELIKFGKKYFSQFPEWDNFASGAKMDYDNAMKTMTLMKGPILDTLTDTWKILKSNYNEGISKEEYPAFAGSSVFGVYSRALGVAQGGYAVKKFVATLQDIEAADDGTDCGTKDYLDIYLDPYFKNEFLYMNMVSDNGKLIMLLPENIDKYLGRRVKLRSPMYCKFDPPKLCSKCLGLHPYKMNIKMIGLASTKIGSTLMNKRLKAFHVKKVYMYDVTVDDLFG